MPSGGVRKADYASRDFYDVWFPNLAPGEALLHEAFPIADDKTWRTFRRRFLAEMKSPAARHDLELLAALSRTADFSIGCYCEDESRCHRSILRELLEKARGGARVSMMGRHRGSPGAPDRAASRVALAADTHRSRQDGLQWDLSDPG